MIKLKSLNLEGLERQKQEISRTLEGKIVNIDQLKEMGFEETDRIESYRLYWYGRNGQEEEITTVKLLAYKDSYQVLTHYLNSKKQ